jgi:hypothetical protein
MLLTKVRNAPARVTKAYNYQTPNSHGGGDMSQVVETKPEHDAMSGMMTLCNGLFEEWLVDLSWEEKEIWLWNASVEMIRIKRRRASSFGA